MGLWALPQANSSTTCGVLLAVVWCEHRSHGGLTTMHSGAANKTLVNFSIIGCGTSARHALVKYKNTPGKAACFAVFLCLKLSRENRGLGRAERTQTRTLLRNAHLNTIAVTKTSSNFVSWRLWLTYKVARSKFNIVPLRRHGAVMSCVVTRPLSKWPLFSCFSLPSRDSCIHPCALKERRSRRLEKRLSKRVFWRVRFFSAPP